MDCEMNTIVDPIIVKCFCDEDDKSGNLAGIYIDQYISNEDKQQIASRLNLPVTVFVTNAKNDIPLVEFFYPSRKMPLCLHGTLAAGYVLFSEFKLSNMSVRAPGGQILNLNRNASNYFEVEVTPDQFEQPSLSLLKASQLLNIDISDINKDLPFAVASVGSPKLLVPISTRDNLDNLNPDYVEIENWSLENKINGIYAYFYDPVTDIFYARGFNPVTGHKEDAATGVAAAALSSQLSRNIIVKQGQILGMPCKINLRFVSPNSIWVGGEIRHINQ